MDVPVVPASRFEGYIVYRYLPGGQRGKIALSNEILREGVVFLAQGERGESGGISRAVRLFSVDLPDQREGAPRLGPAAVKGQLRYDLHGLLPGDAMGPADFQMGFELGILPRREQCRNRDHTAVAEGELRLP